MRSLAVEKLI